ncbi:MAG: metallophosphoesterase [Chitinophagaceae bacterium]|nr:metallophosphoesterase [Chitinophagaceae bacterium]
MKQLSLAILFVLGCFAAFAQDQPFRFAFLSDTHIGSPNGSSEEDLRRAVADINGMTGLDFVVLTGDITELGTNNELKRAKQLLDSLRIPYYIIPGNHDTGWSETGGAGFSNTFGSDRFAFDHKGIRFIGCASGPYVRMSDGHVPRSAILWIDSILNNTTPEQPIVFLNHYPIDNGLDNWYEITDRLKTKNTIAILCGHGHANRKMNFEGIPGVMGRSNLRAKAKVGGFNIVEVTAGNMQFSEHTHNGITAAPWASVVTGIKKENKEYPRPDYSINTKYPRTKQKWVYHSAANVISTPATIKDLVVFGNQDGRFEALSVKNGKRKWTFMTGAAIYSSPAVTSNRIVFASADSNVYCLDTKGKLVWRFKANAAVLGSPYINGDTVFIGSSDHSFRALNLQTGKQIWQFDGLNGPVVSTPLHYNGLIVFGAWDRHLYALRSSDGTLAWKWTNGSSVINFSPASCIPVAHDGVIYIVAPDRYLTAIDAASGTTLWRTNESTVRESIGISQDGTMIYGKTMNDTIVAFKTGRTKALAWKLHCGFGYEHVPSMLVEDHNNIYFGTKNGVVYSVDNNGTKVNWAHKIDNSMVNTVRLVDKQHLVVATMDGKVALLRLKE